MTIERHTSLSCILPAVSINTTSNPASLAKRPEGQYQGRQVRVIDLPYKMASLAIPAASFPYPRSYNSTMAVPPSLSLSILKLRTCTLSCSTAPLRNVSHAAIRTRNPFWISQKQTLERFVDLPTPFTPTKVILYGMRLAEDVDAVAEESLLRIERRRSVDDFGVKMRVRVVERAACTSDLIPMNGKI